MHKAQEGRGLACVGFTRIGSSGSLPTGGYNKYREERCEVQFMETSPKTERPGPDTGQQSEKAAWRKSLQQNQAGERGMNRAGQWSTQAAGTPQARHQTANGHSQQVWGWPSGERMGEFKAGLVREQLRHQA